MGAEAPLLILTPYWPLQSRLSFSLELNTALNQDVCDYTHHSRTKVGPSLKSSPSNILIVGFMFIATKL